MSTPANTRPATDRDGGSLIAILDQLTDILQQARTMPMSASALVNRAEVLDLLDAARAVVPGEIHAADGVLHDADAVLADARARAAALVSEAQEEAERLVGQENVVALAEQRAAGIIADAEATAARLARNANDYCDRQLAQFEIDLAAVTTQVRAGRERLASLGLSDRDEG